MRSGMAGHYRPRHRRAPIDWMTDALCAGYLNFTEATVDEQIAVCQSGCPVQAECALYGVNGPPVSIDKDYGGVVYGAMRPRTLKRLQKARGVS